MSAIAATDPRPSRVVLIEMNELAPRLIARCMAEGLLPNFQRFYDRSTVYVTDAGEDPPNLEPWIAWPAIHYGVDYAHHGAFNLGDGRKIAYKGIADLLSDAGIRTGIFGSMNTNYRDLNGYFVPDPWDTRAEATPADLAPYFDFVSTQVQEHTKEGATGGDKAAFLKFIARNGVSPATVAKIAAQLGKERLDAGVRWRRALLLDHIGYDVFRSLNKRFDVRFATFFSNSVAHFQHYFWRNMDPDDFLHPPDPKDSPSLSSAIREGYRTMDELLGRFMSDYSDATLMFCTALSQQPWTDTTKHCYRPRDFDAFVRFAGIQDQTAIKPVMAEAFQIDFADGASAQRAAQALATLEILPNGRFEGTPAMGFNIHDATIFTGCAVNDPDDAALMVRPVRNHAGEVVPFGSLFYRVTAMRSGRHHRDGCFWVRNGAHRIVENRLELTAIAPMILRHFGVDVPTYMESRTLVEV
jgi:hypothetical protein